MCLKSFGAFLQGHFWGTSKAVPGGGNAVVANPVFNVEAGERTPNSWSHHPTKELWKDCRERCLIQDWHHPSPAAAAGSSSGFREEVSRTKNPGTSKAKALPKCWLWMHRAGCGVHLTAPGFVVCDWLGDVPGTGWDEGKLQHLYLFLCFLPSILSLALLLPEWLASSAMAAVSARLACFILLVIFMN